MQPSKYTPEQEKDIMDRCAQAAKILDELHLTPDAAIQKVRIADGIYADKLIPFLNDTKYADKSTLSPIQKEDIKPDEPAEAAK